MAIWDSVIVKIGNLLTQFIWISHHMLDRHPIVIIVIIDPEEVAKLDQRNLDLFRWVCKSLQLLNVTHFDSLMRIQQALSSLADFDSVVIMAGRERLCLFLLMITPSIAMVPLDTAAPSCGSVSLMPGLSLLHIGAIIANSSLASILCVIEILGSNEYSSEAPTRC